MKLNVHFIIKHNYTRDYLAIKAAVSDDQLELKKMEDHSQVGLHK